MVRLCVVSVVLVSFVESAVCSEARITLSGDAAGTLYVLPEGVETRWASPENWGAERAAAGQVNAGRKGSPSFPLKAGESKVLAEVKGRSGMVRRMWVTISDRDAVMLRGLRLDMYWDGSDKPAVSAPFGDFFCHGIGRMSTFESVLFSSPEGRSFNCNIPMPFKTGMKIVLTNETPRDVAMVFYDVDFTIGDNFADDMLYFHAHWRRENPTTMQKDFEILPKVEGAGRFIGANVGVIANQELYFKSWWGEGEVKVYLDGDKELPTLCGTGTEDYIGSAWGQGQYANWYQGCHLADHEKMQYCFYRWHILDPIYFRKDIRATIHQIGCWGPGNREQMAELGKPLYSNGPGLVEVDISDEANPSEYGLFERQDDWSCCAYFYLNKPVSNLPPLAAVAERVKGL